MEESGKASDSTSRAVFKLSGLSLLKETFRTSFVPGTEVFFGIVKDGGGPVTTGDGGWLDSFSKDANLPIAFDFNFGVRKSKGFRASMVPSGLFFKMGSDRETRSGGGLGMFSCTFRLLSWSSGMIVKDGMYIQLGRLEGAGGFTGFPIPWNPKDVPGLMLIKLVMEKNVSPSSALLSAISFL